MADKRADQLKEITERLEQGVKDIFTSEMYTKYLLTMSKFHNYSFNNTLLIAMQRPDATLVAGYNAWKNKFNRYVKKGEKGIQIIAPAPVKEREEREKIDKDTGLTVLNESGEPEIEVVERVIPRFRVTTVFDYAQTDGEPLPTLEVNELTARVKDYTLLKEAIEQVSPVPIRFGEIEGNAKGYYSHVDKEICVRADMGESQTMVTSENYVLGYKASLIQGVTPVQIRERMEKLNPDRFRVRKFGVSDVIVTSIGGKTQSYYVNPKELIKFNGFFTKLPNGEYLLLNEEGYQVEGQKGTWTVTDEKTIDEQRFVLMVNDQKPDLLPSIVVQSDGKIITSTASGFDNATVRKVRELLHHEKFLENGTAERARESGTEQNYNMIDGCVNNVPKKPRVIGGRVSVLDRLHIKQAERARKDNAQVQQQERTRKN